MSEEITVRDAEVKAEVVDAYHELLHKLKQNKKPSSSASNVVEAADDDMDEIIIDGERTIDDEHAVEDVHAIEQEREIKALASETPEVYTRDIETLKYSVSEALNSVREKVVAEQKKLSTIMSAIDTKNRQLAEIHEIEVNVDTLSALVMAQKEKTRAFEEELHDRRQVFEQEMAQRRREWQQEEQKYIYDRDLKREKERNRYEAAQREAMQELEDLKAKVKKELDERESRIESAETLNERVQQFPEEMRQAVQKAKDTTAKQLTNNFEYEKQILDKELKLRDQTIATLQAKIETLETNIKHFDSLKNSFNRLLASGME